VWTGLVQSVGAGILLVPIQMIAFPTLAPQLRTEAAAVFNLVRSVFSSVGVSIALTLFVVASTEGHARLVEYVSPYAQGLRFAAKSSGVNASTEHGLAMIEQEIQAQAAMLGYNRIFLFIAVASLIALPLLLLIGRRSTSVSGSDHDPAADTDAVIAAE
jgi:DHA2 family multidrug resistance protein